MNNTEREFFQSIQELQNIIIKAEKLGYKIVMLIHKIGEEDEPGWFVAKDVAFNYILPEKKELDK